MFYLALGALLWVLASGPVTPANAQSTGTDASVTAGLTSPTNLVRWSGNLPDAAGKTVDLSFSIFQDSAGGLALWNETQPVKVGADGRYTVLLGATSADGLPQSLFQAGEARWIEARPVTGLSPDTAIEAIDAAPPARSLLTAVPYAFKSVDAETLAGRSAEDYVTREDLQSTVANQVQAFSNVAGAPLPVAGSSSGQGTAGYLPVWIAPTTLGNSIVAQTESGIGIGTSSPATMLDVNGPSTLRGTVSLLASAATLVTGINSPALQLGASTYSSATKTAVPQNFVWQTASAGNNTANPTANLSLLFGSGSESPRPTGLSIAPNGQITFAPGQTFPAASNGSETDSTSSALTGVTAGPGLTGGGTQGNVTLALSEPISTANGGTGATTPVQALAKLGIPMVSVLNYGAKGDGVTDDGAAINSALAANSSFSSPCVYFPSAVFYTTKTIVSGSGSNIDICGQVGQGSIIKYHGSGVGLQIGSSSQRIGGRIENLTVFSDGGNGSIGIQVTNGTDLVMRNVYVGGSPALRFGIGWDFVQTGLICDVCTSSWNPIGFHFGWGTFANSSIEIKGGDIWEASTAAFQIDDASELDIHDNWIEHTPTAFLFTNTSVNGTVAHSINIAHNWGVTLSTTYADPKFIRVLGANAHTDLDAWQVHVSENSYQAGGTNKYCNLMDWRETDPGSMGRYYFDHNSFSGCTVAGIDSTTAAFNVAIDVSDWVEGLSPLSPSLPMLAGTYKLIQTTNASQGTSKLPFSSVFIGNSSDKAAQIVVGNLLTPRTITLPDADSNTVQPLVMPPSGGCVGYVDANGVQHGAACTPLVGIITLSHSPTDKATIMGVTTSSRCVFSATNATAAAPTTQAYISSINANTVTIAHAGGSGGTFNILCTSN